MAAVQDRHLLADHALAASARCGVRSAFDELYSRHALAAWRLALVVTRDEADAQDAVANGLASTLTRSTDPEPGAAGESLRVALLRSTRRSAIDVVSHRSLGGPLRSEAPVLDAVEPRVAVIRRAYDELPERWRSVLWLVEVDGLAPAEVAQVIHVVPTAVAPLLERAHRGFQEQVLLIGIGASAPAACRRTSDRLTDYRVGSLLESDEAQVRSHLDACASCRARLASLDDLIPVLRGTGRPLPAVLAEVAETRWSAALVVDSGPLHLVLPGGQPMPAWAQRAFAGVVAGVVALGITGATMIAGRGRGDGRDVIARPDLAGGESALGGSGLSDLNLSSGGLGGLPATPPTSRASAARASGPALPRSDGSSAELSPPPTPPPAPQLGGGVMQHPADDQPEGGSDSSQVLAVVIAGVGGVTLSLECQGGELLGNAFGDCALPEPTGPVTVKLPLAAPSLSTLLSR